MFKRFTLLVLCCLLLVSISPSAQGVELTGRQIMDKSRALEKVRDFSATMQMEIVNKKGQSRMRTLSMTTLRDVDGSEYSLIKFVAPADVRGTAFLSISRTDGVEEKILYLPALGKERRLASSERGGSFMGSDFTYEDISLDMDDYTYNLLGTKKIDGIATYVVEAVPVSQEIAEEIGFAKRVAYVSQEDYVIRKTEVYDGEGNVLRVMTTSKTRQITDELSIATRLEMQTLSAGTRTVLIYEDVSVDSGLTKEDFSRRQLTRPVR